MLADGQTDMTKLLVAFRSFSVAPKNKHRQQQMFVLCSDNNFYETLAGTKLL
jgi:hypothetical protein